MHNAKITLTKEKETLFVPLYGKAMASRQPDPILVDRKAEEILARIDYDFSQLRTPPQTRVTLAMRAKKLDEVVRNFLAAHSPGLVLHLGCGLDSRIERVAPGPVPWYDLDYPEVIDLRRRFYAETATYRMLGYSVTDPAWLAAVPEPGPAIIVAEGLLMYLPSADVKALVLRLRERFPGSELAADVFSQATVDRIRRHPGIRKTQAEIHWGLDDAREVESWAPGIRLLEEWPYTASPDVGKLGLAFRLMFRLMGAIPAAKKAHRVVRYLL
jgi:O-methyltransferase involved in polyketide biosynthesis